MTDVSFIIPAAGSGSRMGGDIPKPFISLAGRPVIFHTLQRVGECAGVKEIVLLLPEKNMDSLVREYGEGLYKLGVTEIIPGGASRQESVSKGLKALAEKSDLVAVHDAVRPFADVELFIKLFEAAEKYGGALPVTPITDTIKELEEHVIKKTVPRHNLYAVQTPQVFSRDIFEKAYRQANSLGEEITDDASLIEKNGGTVVGVDGKRFNIKITTPEDLLLAEALLRSQF